MVGTTYSFIFWNYYHSSCNQYLYIRLSDFIPALLHIKRGKLDKECFMFIVRKDRKKFSRVHKLLKSNEELKTVNKVELKEDI
jgi:hypothetical protein